MEKDVNKLQAVRKAAGLTQQQLAEKSGVSYSLICKFESGERNIKLAGASRLTKLCEALGCRMRDIVTDQSIIDWDENTPPMLKQLQIVMEQVEREATAERMQEWTEQEQAEPVEETGIKIRKVIPIEYEFDMAFIPPEEFSDSPDSMCHLCPFCEEEYFEESIDFWEQRFYCSYPENVDDKCHLGKHFK